MSNDQFSQADLMEALRYAVKLIDDVAQLAQQKLESVAMPTVDPETGLPDSAASAAAMLHRADLRGLAAYGPSNAAALRAIVNGEPAKAWFDPMSDIRARLGQR